MKVFRIVGLTLGAFFLAVLGFYVFYFVRTYHFYDHNRGNPFSNVEWLLDYPGANSRYVEYTPVLKSNNSIILGPPVGADYGALRFEDTNNDGTKEAIIETEVIINLGQYYFPQRHTVEYQMDSSGLPKFVLIKSESFPEKVPEIYRNLEKYE